MATVPLLLSQRPSPSSLLLPHPITPIFSQSIISIRNPIKSLHHRPTTITTSTIPLSSSSFRNVPSPSETECPVPHDQQPINEYKNLSNSFPFSWASSDLIEYCSNLILTGASFVRYVGLPVAWFGVVNPESQPLKCVFGAVSSGLFVVTLVVLHMYLGWAYVGNRLLSATVEYEESGWYDGQIWVKTAEVLARDRLLGSFSVKPVLRRLKLTLVGLATCLVISVFLLINIEVGQKNTYISSEEAGGRAVPGVYNDESARSFEPDAFCGEPDLL